MTKAVKNGFTLIEMVIVIVLLGIVSSIGVGLLSIVFNGYIDARNLFYLFYEAKFGVERMDREFREAIPNSIVLNDNQTITFVKFKSGSFYDRLSENKIEVKESGVTLNIDDKISIYNTNVHQIYTSSYCNIGDNSSRVYRIDNNTDNITLCKSIVADSPMNKFYIIDEVVTFKKSGNAVLRCSSKVFTNYPVNENCMVLFKHIGYISFKYDEKSYFINDQLIDISLEMSKNNVELPYKHKVHIRNTP